MTVHCYMSSGTNGGRSDGTRYMTSGTNVEVTVHVI